MQLALWLYWQLQVCSYNIWQLHVLLYMMGYFHEMWTLANLMSSSYVYV